MNFLAHDTLAGYARTAIDLRSRMVDYHRSPLSHDWLDAFMSTRLADTAQPPTPKVLDAIRRVSALPWRDGQPYVVAPAMTAVVAAAAQALDLAGEVLPDDIAPDDRGVLLLPEPVYQRDLTGAVTSIGAITWARTTTATTGAGSWFICGWADHHDPLDPAAASRWPPDLTWPASSARTSWSPSTACQSAGPSMPAPTRRSSTTPTSTGRTRPTAATCSTRPPCTPRSAPRWCTRSGVSRPSRWPPCHPAPRGACLDPPRHPRGDAAPHQPSRRVRRRQPERAYRVRFFVRGHWRRLIDRDGNPYRIWINAHIKGPDGAPLLLGEKVAVLAR